MKPESPTDTNLLCSWRTFVARAAELRDGPQTGGPQGLLNLPELLSATSAGVRVPPWLERAAVALLVPVGTTPVAAATLWVPPLWRLPQNSLPLELRVDLGHVRPHGGVVPGAGLLLHDYLWGPGASRRKVGSKLCMVTISGCVITCGEGAREVTWESFITWWTRQASGRAAGVRGKLSAGPPGGLSPA